MNRRQFFEKMGVGTLAATIMSGGLITTSTMDGEVLTVYPLSKDEPITITNSKVHYVKWTPGHTRTRCGCTILSVIED